MNLNENWQKAWNYYQNKEFQSALRLLNQIDEVQDDPTVCFVIAQCHWQLGRWRKHFIQQRTSHNSLYLEINFLGRFLFVIITYLLFEEIRNASSLSNFFLHEVLRI